MLVLRHGARRGGAVAGVSDAVPPGDDHPRASRPVVRGQPVPHSEADIAAAVEIVDEALDVYAAALEGGVERFLPRRPVQPVYRSFN